MRPYAPILVLTTGLLLTGCSGTGTMCSVLALRDLPRRTYDEGLRDPADETAIRAATQRKWPRGAPYWRVARDVLTSGARVEAPDTVRAGTGGRPDPHSLVPATAWVVRFGHEYIEVAAAEFAWYGVWWYTILLEFDAGALDSVQVFSDSVTL